jgi:hypothetical protein
MTERGCTMALVSGETDAAFTAPRVAVSKLAAFTGEAFAVSAWT